MRRAALLFLAALSASGCDGVKLYGTSYMSYGTDALGLAGSDGPVAVELLDPPVAAAPIIALLNDGARSLGVRFGLDLPANRYGYRLVLDFGARRANPCAVNPAAYPRPADPMRIIVGAAFCRDGGALSQTIGDAPRPAGPEDPALRRLLSGILLELFPPRPPEVLEFDQNN